MEANTPTDLGVDTLQSDKKTIRLNYMVKCPVCGKVGVLVLRRRKERWYGYVYHGYQGRKKIEHYIGVAPEPDSPDFESWVHSIEKKHRITIELVESEYSKLLEIALSKNMNVEEYITYMIRQAIEQRKREQLEQKLSELESKRTPPPSSPRAARGSGRSGGGKQWEWWKGGARRS